MKKSVGHKEGRQMKQNHNPEKLRRGSLSLILSIAVVALVIVLNVVLTALSGL